MENVLLAAFVMVVIISYYIEGKVLRSEFKNHKNTVHRPLQEYLSRWRYSAELFFGVRKLRSPQLKRELLYMRITGATGVVLFVLMLFWSS